QSGHLGVDARKHARSLVDAGQPRRHSQQHGVRRRPCALLRRHDAVLLLRACRWPRQERSVRHDAAAHQCLRLHPFNQRTQLTHTLWRRTMNTHTWRFGLATFVTLALACEPDGRPLGPNTPALSASREGVPFAEGLSSPGWQQPARNLVVQARLGPLAAAHAYPLLGVAQYLAVQRAEAADTVGGRALLETDRGAVAGASVAVLSYLFPSQALALEDSVAAQANAGPGQPHPAFAAGEAIGRAVGAEIVTRAQNDGWDHAFTGTIPTGDGFWKSSTDPATVACGQLPGVRPWFLTSASQFRSAPPPAFGSTAFQADLAEIRAMSDTRTAAQVDIATFWALGVGTPTTSGFWIQRSEER